MELSRRRVLLWIKPTAAGLLLGRPSLRRSTSRWVLRGTLHEDPESGLGLWTRVRTLDELGAGRSSGKLRASWWIRPQLCLVRWDWIQILQVFDVDEREGGLIGFRIERRSRDGDGANGRLRAMETDLRSPVIRRDDRDDRRAPRPLRGA